MSNEIQMYQPATMNTWAMIEAIAPTMKKSGLFGVSSESQAMAIMLSGHELGLSLTSSFELIHVIQGKPSLSPKGALALIHRSGLLEQIDIKDNPDSCTVSMKRVGGTTYSTTFTMDDAKRAGLIKNGGGWERYPSNLMRWRAIGYCADILFPDVLGGLHRADEFGAEINTVGEVVNIVSLDDVEVINPDGGTVDAPDDNDIQALLKFLIDEFGAEVVLRESGGSIPMTLDEARAVRDKLVGVYA